MASVISAPNAASACFFDRSWPSATSAAICLSVTVARGAALADDMRNSLNRFGGDTCPHRPDSGKSPRMCLIRHGLAERRPPSGCSGHGACETVVEAMLMWPASFLLPPAKGGIR